jgi:hypothetical protein
MAIWMLFENNRARMAHAKGREQKRPPPLHLAA